MDYRPHGVCSQLIRVDVEDNIIKNVEFVGGCSGNTQGVSRLVRERCDGALSIPLRGRLSSLNASVAAGILLYEAAKQRCT